MLHQLSTKRFYLLKRNALNEKNFHHKTSNRFSIESPGNQLLTLRQKEVFIYYLFNLIPFSDFSLKGKNMILLS